MGNAAALNPGTRRSGGSVLSMPPNSFRGLASVLGLAPAGTVQLQQSRGQALQLLLHHVAGASVAHLDRPAGEYCHDLRIELAAGVADDLPHGILVGQRMAVRPPRYHRGVKDGPREEARIPPAEP